MRSTEIEEQDRYLLERQQRFRVAADVVTDTWAAFPEVHAIAVIGSVAKRLWKEIPRFSGFRRRGIEVWHECHDVDLALWIDSQHRLGELRRAGVVALRDAFASGAATSVANHELDVFLFEPGSDRYLGRLCKCNQCPKGKSDCLVPGCGAMPFNKVVPDFSPRADLLAGTADTMLYRRGTGRLRSALDLPTVDQERAPSSRSVSPHS